MKKVVLASLLAVAGTLPLSSLVRAQAPAGGAAAGGSGIQMSQEEYAAYNNATTQTTPAAKAAAFEAYLKAAPTRMLSPMRPRNRRRSIRWRPMPRRA